MKIHQSTARRWGRLGITKKISLMFGVLLVLILLVSIGSYITLDNARKEAESAILNSMQIQRLVLRMDSGLERARRLQRDFFLQYPQVSFSKARDTYATQAVLQMANVISLSTDLRSLIRQSNVSASLQASKIDINLYLSTSQRYSDTFLEAVELVTQLAGEQDGLETQIQTNASWLHNALVPTQYPEWHDLYQDIRLYEKDYLLTRQRSSMQSAFNRLTELQHAVESAADLSAPQKTALLADIQGYQSSAEQIVQLDADIHSKLNDFNLQAESVDPISKKLIELSDAEVERARQQVERANQLAGMSLAVTSLAIVGLALLAANVLHRSITNNIINLTKAAGELQGGNLDVIAPIKSEDELGDLARAFNTMTSRLKESFLSLQSSESRFRLLAENSSDMISRHDAQGAYLYVSPACRTLLGYEPEELIGHPAFEFIHPDDIFTVDQTRSTIIEQPIVSTTVYRVRCKNGDYIWLETTSRTIFDEAGSTVEIHAASRDVTERKQAEDALRENEEKFSKLFRSSPEAILLTEINSGKIIEVNKSFEKFSGYSHDELIGHLMLDLGMYSPGGRQRFVSMLKEHGSIHNVEFDVKNKAGKQLLVLASAEMIEINGETHTLTILQDITERKRAEEALKLRESYLTAIIENQPGLVSLKDINGRFLAVNGAFSLACKKESAEILGKTDLEVWPIEFAEKYQAADIEVIQQKRPLYIEESVFDEGQTKWYETFKMPVFDETRQVVGTTSFAREITERKQAEEKLSRQLTQLQLLRVIDTAIISSVDLDANLNLIAKKAVEQLQIDAVSILLLNQETHTLDFAAGEGFRTDALQFAHLEMGEGTAGRAAQERRTIHIPNLHNSDENPALTQAIGEEGFIAYYGIPLIAKDQLLGVLEIFNRSPLPAEPDWLSFIETLAGQASISIDSATLVSDLQKSHTELELAYDATLEGWSHAMDLRDKETEGHTQRVTEMAVKLAIAMQLSEDEIIQVKRGALLHDIGKMGIPDAILLKPGKLTDEEWVVMRKHPVYARDMLSRIEYLQPALDIPYCHHEKWDGTGYPRGLKGEQIPLAARLFAIVDVWDALRYDRPYRLGWPEEKVTEYIRSQAGTHFDPKVVNLFFGRLGENAPGPDRRPEPGDEDDAIL